MIDMIPTLRSELEVAVASANALETEVKIRQERLRVATDKVERLKGLLAVYEAEATADHPNPPTPSADTNAKTLAEPVDGLVWRASTKKARMCSEVDELLTLHGTMHRKAILGHLFEKGIMGTEKNPLAHLAAFLSDNREKYAPDGRGNFSLRPHEPPPAPGGVGSAGVGDAASNSARP
jgi:hypothetical protein